MRDFSEKVKTLGETYENLISLGIEEKLAQAAKECIKSLRSGKQILVCGNGGSAADAQHLAAELVGRFKYDRKALNVISLTTDSSIITAWSNDQSFDNVFSRQVEAYGKKNAILIVLTTSGNSKNIISAIKTARMNKMIIIGFTGKGGGMVKPECDICLDVPSDDTALIQEIHISLYHFLCEIIEEAFR